MFKNTVRSSKFRAQGLPQPETSKNQFLKPFLEHWQNLSNLAHFGSVSSFCGQGLTVPSTLVEGVINASTFMEGMIHALSLVEGVINTDLAEGVINAFTLAEGVARAFALSEG